MRRSSSEKFSLFLAGSPVEIISALACIAECAPPLPVLFLERSISQNRQAVDSLIAAALVRFEKLTICEFQIDREQQLKNFTETWAPLARLCWMKQLRKTIGDAVENAFRTSLDNLEASVDCVYFTGLPDYVRIVLDSCRKCRRVIYPHGFVSPLSEHILEFPFLFRPRTFLNSLRSIAHMKSTAGTGEILISALHRMVGRRATCVPYDGTDEVFTFRESFPKIEIPVRHLGNLRETFMWLAEVSPWKEALEAVRKDIPENSIVLLLSEYNRNPIWEENLNWEQTHVSLACQTLDAACSNSLLIKSHPRSKIDGAARIAKGVFSLRPDTSVRVLPIELSSLPIEALALNLNFAAACSLGSCSLPSDIGINVPHFAIPSLSDCFDEGWVGVPFWAKYGDLSRMLIAEGICQNLCPASSQSLSTTCIQPAS